MKPEQLIADKSAKFGAGPWVDEPDRVEWRHEGFACLMVRQQEAGHWCGYVGVPPGHPWHGKRDVDIDARVHGGVTYGEPCDGLVCHVPEPGEPEHLWWVGFDCSHAFDLRPRDEAVWRKLRGWRPSMLTRCLYRDQAYVQVNVEELAEQAKEAAGGVRDLDQQLDTRGVDHG